MAQGALFIGWGAPIVGRETAALELFKEARDFYERLMKRGEITAFEPVILSHAGGPLQGFFLLRGESLKIANLAVQEDFIRLSTKASLILENLTIVPAFVGDAVPKMIEMFRAEINTLALQHQQV